MQDVQASLRSWERQAKEDYSPVTVADYASQAVVAWSLQASFPDTPLSLVAEEDSDDLRDPSQAAMLRRITELFNRTVGVSLSEEEVAALIDLGSSRGGSTGRHWVLDPIDGTRGFVGGRQYAICLALLVDGIPTLGVLGCPNLPLEGPVTQQVVDSKGGSGCLFYAIKGRGAYCAPLFDGADLAPQRIRCRKASDAGTGIYMTSFEERHSQHDLTDTLAHEVGINAPPLKLDSQAKYGLLARGDAAAFLRIPRPGYREKIWDHAAGVVIVSEAGGRVTDLHGNELDFGLGAHLDGIQGGGIVAAAPAELHERLVQAAIKREK